MIGRYAQDVVWGQRGYLAEYADYDRVLPPRWPLDDRLPGTLFSATVAVRLGADTYAARDGGILLWDGD